MYVLCVVASSCIPRLTEKAQGKRETERERERANKRFLDSSPLSGEIIVVFTVKTVAVPFDVFYKKNDTFCYFMAKSILAILLSKDMI